MCFKIINIITCVIKFLSGNVDKFNNNYNKILINTIHNYSYFSFFNNNY